MQYSVENLKRSHTGKEVTARYRRAMDNVGSGTCTWSQIGGHYALIDERHYSPKELGELWDLSADTIIRMLGREPDVMRFSPTARRGVRRKITYRIPESVVQRFYDGHRNK